MKTFNEGDRVSHPTYGEGTVINPYDGTGWTTVQFDSDEKYMTDTHMLTPLPKAGKFKVGDRVSHPLHRDGTVKEILDNGLHFVSLIGDRGYYALEHQITPAVPEPKFTVTVVYPHTEVKSTPASRKHTEAYLANFSDWSTIDSITITRVKG